MPKGYILSGVKLSQILRRIEEHDFLFVDEETGDSMRRFGVSVFDKRDGVNLGTVIQSMDSLDYLIKHGAERWLESPFNGVGGKGCEFCRKKFNRPDDRAFQCPYCASTYPIPD